MTGFCIIVCMNCMCKLFFHLDIYTIYFEFPIYLNSVRFNTYFSTYNFKIYSGYNEIVSDLYRPFHRKSKRTILKKVIFLLMRGKKTWIKSTITITFKRSNFSKPDFWCKKFFFNTITSLSARQGIASKRHFNRTLYLIPSLYVIDFN